MTICSSSPSQNIVLPLRSGKYQSGNLHLQTHVSLRSSLAILHVFEATIKVPKFASFKMVEKGSQTQRPVSELNFTISESINQLLQWLTGSFVLTVPLQVEGLLNYIYFRCLILTIVTQASVDKIKAFFVGSMKLGESRPSEANNHLGCEPLHINAATVIEAKTNIKRLAVRIRCNSIDLAAEIVQDLATQLNIVDLESTAEFPEELEKFSEVY
jgi:hypothetical protein